MSESLPPVAPVAPRDPGTAPAARAAETRVRFLSSAQREEACRTFAARGALVVKLDAIGAAARGRLAGFIDEAIEHELDAHGAAAPGIGSASDADAALGDQLFRARRVQRAGIVVALGPLRAALSTMDALEPEDGAVLRFWAAASVDRPVCLLLDTRDQATGAYAEPIALAAILDEAQQLAPPIVASVASVASVEERSEPATEDTPPIDAVSAVAVEAVAIPPPAPVAVAEPAPVEPEPAHAGPVAAKPLAARHVVGASVAASSDEWRTWVLSLSAARGPQSLAAFEKLFSRDYMPLANAIAAGLDDPRALAAHEEFRRTFSRAYAEASPAFAATGKRPKMVLDAPDVAGRIARLHGARTTQILLVDGMRFDVGARIRESVRAALGVQASLTDELVLWSALPTNTLRQLETLQRGAEALRATAIETEREVEPLRGRTAEVIRRVKIGSRDLYKLDVVEARVRDLGPRALAALGEIAETAAESIVRHAQTLQPRTLLFVFGDHGFTFERDGTARQGGASPEEVLVPAFALLIGDVH